MKLKSEIERKRKSENENREVTENKEEKRVASWEKKEKEPAERKEKAKMSFYAKESEVKRAFLADQPMIFLVYKESYLNLDETNQSLPSLAVSLLQEFEDVFPEEMPSGLPPIRGIEHQIDFIPGAVIPNRGDQGASKASWRFVEQGLREREHESMCSTSVTSSKEGWDLEDVHWLQSGQQYYGKVPPSHS
jgi:hypothetical protein